MHSLLIAIFLLISSAATAAATGDTPDSPAANEVGSPDPAGDESISRRLHAIFHEIPSLEGITIDVEAGVVTLSGITADGKAAQRAETLASQISGVVAVENAIERDTSLYNQLTPALKSSRSLLNDTIAMLPLFSFAVIVFTVLIFIGSRLAQRRSFWERVTPNRFIAELAATTVRAIFLLLALVISLNLLGATALLSAVLGSAGVIGLAVGFAVRDTIENYIASILLSLRQPFRPKDHVVINGMEGRVIRLTSRATVLMTLDGNHLRIPNAEVFKANILNYTTNPERRFTFELGIDGDDDPLAAIQTGGEALQQLTFVLKEPPPLGIIQNVGDSNIVIFYAAWINQRDSDFGKSRSHALSAVKHALEEAGFALPEPIYRLRLDESSAAMISGRPRGEVDRARGHEPARPEPEPAAETPVPVDTSPDDPITRKVEDERRGSQEEDLLSEAAPRE